jgi:hypothetical protein
MKQGVFQRAYRFFWYLTTVITGILAGFMLSHSIMLGRYYSWLAEDAGRMDLMKQTYAAFRAEYRPQDLYNFFLYLSLPIGIAFVILALILKKDRILSAFAGLSTFWVGAIYFLSGLSTAESAVLKAEADRQIALYFASINVPAHVCFAVLYTMSFVLLLFIGMKTKKFGDV